MLPKFAAGYFIYVFKLVCIGRWRAVDALLLKSRQHAKGLCSPVLVGGVKIKNWKYLVENIQDTWSSAYLFPGVFSGGHS